MEQSVTVQGKVHPSTIQFQQGVSIEDLCEQIKGSPLDYLLNFDPGQEAHRQQFKSCLRSGDIDILGSSPDVLARIEPGFKSKRTQEIFQELKETERNGSTIMKDLEKADLAVSKSLEIERKNLDLSAVDGNRKLLRERREHLEDVQIKVETYARKKADLWEKLFESLSDFQLKRVEAKVKEILPEMEKFNAQAKANNRHFQQNIAPKLRELNALNPASPGELYFTHLNLTDFQVRQLKTLEAFPQIKVIQDRFEFHLEVAPYVKK